MLLRYVIRIADIADFATIYTHLRVERSTDGGDTFNVLRDLLLDPAVRDYTVLDGNAEAEYVYRAFMWNQQTGETSSVVDQRTGAPDPALDILSVDELKNHYLFGIDLRDDNGNPFPDSMFEHFIRAAVEKAEQVLDLPLRPRTIVDEAHDFYRQDYKQYIYIKTEHSPVIDVSELRLVLPSNTQVISFPQDWLKVTHVSGTVQVLPGNGAIGMVAVGSAGMWLPLVSGYTDFIPQIFRISYTAGFVGRIPQNIVDIVGKLAAFGPLGVAGDLVLGAGIASESIGLDGVNTAVTTTQSATNAGYGARINQYRRELAEEIPNVRMYWKGLRFVVG